MHALRSFLCYRSNTEGKTEGKTERKTTLRKAEGSGAESSAISQEGSEGPPYNILSDSLYGRDDRVSSSDEITQANTFSGLPTEILLIITEYLEVVDLACLSLCNHRLQKLTRWTNCMGCTKEDKLLILTRLERDFPQYYACCHCYLLHACDGSDSRFFGMSGGYIGLRGRPCEPKYYESHLSDSKLAGNVFKSHSTKNYSLSQFYFLHVKLAMRAFQYGAQYGIDSKSFQYTQVRYFAPDKFHSGITSLFCREAHVCPSHLDLGLCLRMQDIMLVCTGRDLIPLPGDPKDPDDIDDWNFPKNPSHVLRVCRHILFADLTAGIQRLLNSNLKPTSETLITYRCAGCNTEACLEVQPMNFKIALIMTKWVGLGHGTHPQEPIWKYRFIRNYEEDKFEPENLESPRICFEEMASMPFRSLKFHNLSLLRGKAYQTHPHFYKCKQEEIPAYYVDWKGREILKPELWFDRYRESTTAVLTAAASTLPKSCWHTSDRDKKNAKAAPSPAAPTYDELEIENCHLQRQVDCLHKDITDLQTTIGEARGDLMRALRG